MDKLNYILFGMACGVLASDSVLLISTPPKGIPAQLASPLTPSPLLVDISATVTDAGVHELPRDARMQDAIEMAGGFLLDADTDAVNLAARVMDEQPQEVEMRYQSLAGQEVFVGFPLKGFVQEYLN